MSKTARGSLSVVLCLLVAGCAPTIQPTPPPTPTPVQTSPPATPTITQPPPTPTAVRRPDRAVLYYFREMLENPSAQAMLNLTPPEALRDLHLELAARKAALESVEAQMRRAYRHGGKSATLAFVPAWSVARRDYDETLARAYPLWQEYVAPLGIELPVSFEERYLFTGMDFTAPQDGWIVGRNGTLLHYDGKSWQRLNSPFEGDLLAVDMVSPLEGWVVAGSRGTSDMRLLHLQDGQWRVEENPSRRPVIRGLRALSAQNVWLLTTTPGEAEAELWQYDGEHWQQRGEVAFSAPGGLHMPAPSCGWLSGANGETVVLYTGGVWRNYPLQTPEKSEMRHINFFECQTGWAVGEHGRAFIFDSAGWRPVRPLSADDLLQVAAINRYQAWATARGGKLLFFNGVEWSEVESPTDRDLTLLTFYGSELGFAGGEDGVVLRYQGGAWASDAFPIASGFFQPPLILSEQDAWAITSLQGILHFDGKTWNLVSEWPDVIR